MTTHLSAVIIQIVLYSVTVAYAMTACFGRRACPPPRFQFHLIGALSTAAIVLFLVPHLLWAVGRWPWPIRHVSAVWHSANAVGMALLIWVLRQRDRVAVGGEGE